MNELIKRLDFKKITPIDDFIDKSWEAVIGLYKYRIDRKAIEKNVHYVFFGKNRIRYTSENLERAKEICQEDFEERVSELLTPKEQPNE